jgi:hypothetical protein
MSFNKIITIIFVFFLLVSCKKEYDNYLYETVSINLSNADNSGENVVLTNIDSIPKESYAINVEYTMNQTGVDGDYIINGESNFKNEYQVSSFNIYALENFDTNHPSGESLNDYFLFSSGAAYYTTNTIESINNVGSGNFNGEWGVETWKSSQYLILMRPPLNNGIYSFVVEIVQSNNSVLIDTITTKLY